MLGKKINFSWRFWFILVGFLGMGIGFWYQLNKLRSLTYGLEVVERYQNEYLSINSYPQPVHINIPWFVNVDIGISNLDKNKATYVVQSARPFGNGNIIVYGHNTREILGNIRALKGNEVVTLTLANGMVRKYKINSLWQVNPKDTSYLQPSNIEKLTLYTCSGFADSQRFVVVAVPIETF